MALRLQLVGEEQDGRAFYFSQRRIALGRSGRCDLVVYAPEVAPVQALLWRRWLAGKAARYHIKNVSPRGEVRLNGRVLAPGQSASVANDDVLQVGPAELLCEFVATEAKVGRLRSGHQGLGEGSAIVGSGRYVGYRRPFLHWLGSLPPASRWLLLGSLLVCFVAMLGSLVLLASRQPLDHSDRVFAIGLETSGRTFGRGRVRVPTPKRANFSFEYNGGMVTLTFAAGAINDDRELAIVLNGHEIGYVPRAPQGWRTGLSMMLPRRWLVDGLNRLSFEHASARLIGGDSLEVAVAEDGQATWGIGQLAVEERPLPPVDFARAQQLFDLAKDTFATRSVAPENLLRSVFYFEQALLFTSGPRSGSDAIGVSPSNSAAATVTNGDSDAAKSELVTSLVVGHGEALSQLKDIYEQGMFEAAKERRMGRHDRAVRRLQKLLAYFPVLRGDVDLPVPAGQRERAEILALLRRYKAAGSARQAS